MGSGRFPVLWKVGYRVCPAQNPFPGLPAVPSLVPQGWHSALNQARGSALLSAAWGRGAGMVSHRAADTGHSLQLSTPALHSCSQHRGFLPAGVRITAMPALGCLERPWHYSYCKVALLVNSNYKLVNSTMVELL